MRALLLLLSLLLFSCKPPGGTMKHTNALINETSPYLKMHAHNPVNWFPWGAEAFEKAEKENKLVIISIGYAACHWCHVMEHESFANDSVAGIMNDKFISIKVDREERPDVDQIYMDAVHLLRGSGGWPLNAIALPNGKPVYAGTYFPKEQWTDLLKQIDSVYRADPKKVFLQADNITQGIQKNELSGIGEYSEHEFLSKDVSAIHSGILQSMDTLYGGRKGAPKFPMPVGIEFLLRHNFHAPYVQTTKAISVTLDRMGRGGIYDQLAGGFSRYSVDQYWRVPHFEKMLYDNGQLIDLYSKGYTVFGKEEYKDIVYETIAFLNRDMSTNDGAFYASYDADSEGEEGTYYVWEANDIDRILGTDAKIFKEVYTISQYGNWEKGKNVMHQDSPLEAIAEKNNVSPAQLKEQLAQNRTKLLQLRNKRVAPALDDKIITSWNALTISGLLSAYTAFGDATFLKRAERGMDFILTKLKMNDGGLYHNFKQGKPTIAGFSDDYAFTIKALIELYQSTFNEKWLYLADTLTQYTIHNFWTDSTGLFQYTAVDNKELIAEKYETSDNVIPASNSTLAENLFLLGTILNKSDYLQKATHMINVVYKNLVRGGFYYANWSRQLINYTEPHFEIAIVGPDAENVRKEFATHYLPNSILLGGETERTLDLLEYKLIEGQTTIYVCSGKVCNNPTTDISDALLQVQPTNVTNKH